MLTNFTWTAKLNSLTRFLMTEKEKISIITEEESMLERMKNYHINTNVCFNNISRIKTNAFFFFVIILTESCRIFLIFLFHFRLDSQYLSIFWLTICLGRFSLKRIINFVIKIHSGNGGKHPIEVTFWSISMSRSVVEIQYKNGPAN